MLRALVPAPNVCGDKIIWGWSEDNETYARTNIYTIFSLRMFGDLNFDDTIDAADYAAADHWPERDKRGC